MLARVAKMTFDVIDGLNLEDRLFVLMTVAFRESTEYYVVLRNIFTNDVCFVLMTVAGI